MSWSSRRQMKIIVSLLLLLVGGLAFVLIPLFTQKPTCFDNRQNGDESGIDCGGVCTLQCKQFTQDVSIKWARSYEITKGFYNAVAYMENQNFNSGAQHVGYKFKLYDEDRVLIKETERKETFIEPNKGIIVFEQQIPVGNARPVYTTFTLDEGFSWYKTDPKYNDMVIEVTDQLFDAKDIKPRFSATLKNGSDVYTISNIDTYVVAYDTDGNAIQVGKTFVKTLSPREKKSIFVIWQKQFTTPPVRFEVIPRYDPFTQEYPKR